MMIEYLEQTAIFYLRFLTKIDEKEDISTHNYRLFFVRRIGYE